MTIRPFGRDLQFVEVVRYAVHYLRFGEAFLQSPKLAETSCAIVDIRSRP